MYSTCIVLHSCRMPEPQPKYLNVQIVTDIVHIINKLENVKLEKKKTGWHRERFPHCIYKHSCCHGTPDEGVTKRIVPRTAPKHLQASRGSSICEELREDILVNVLFKKFNKSQILFVFNFKATMLGSI